MTIATPTFSIQRSQDRYCADHGWLKTCYSFSFADYYDPNNQNWGALRVLNDDRIAAGQGFPPHPHRDMEIITYVLSGALEHQDSMGNRGVVGPGGIQYMSAGAGVRHSEFNHSKTDELHLVQMWIVPPKTGLPTQYGQRDFAMADRDGRWLLVASGKAGANASISLQQNAAFSVARLVDGAVDYSFDPARLGFLFVAEGAVVANSERLETGDAVRMAAITSLDVKGNGELLLWDLPDLG
jgi:quercetin 2,3-dioxygenase